MIDAFLSLGLDPEKVTVIAGIGCAGRITAYLDYSTVHTAHGRALAVATGAKLADPYPRSWWSWATATAPPSAATT